MNIKYYDFVQSRCVRTIGYIDEFGSINLEKKKEALDIWGLVNAPLKNKNLTDSMLWELDAALASIETFSFYLPNTKPVFVYV